MFSRVLAPLDGSALAERALAHIAGLVQHESEVTLLRVIEPGEASLIDPLEWRLRRNEAEAYLDGVAEGLQQMICARPETLVLEGRAADRILEAAQDTETQLLVLSSHGRGGLNAWNLNSVASKVAHRAGASLLLVRSYRAPETLEGAEWRPERYGRILVPLDGSLRAEHVLPTANALAERHGATLVLAHVVTLPRAIERMPPTAEAAAVQQRARADHNAQAERYLAQMAAGLTADTETRLVENNDAAAALHRLAADEQVDLVLLSAHGHSAQRFWPYGSLALSFMLHGTTPLLVLQDIPWDALEPSGAEMAARNMTTIPVLRAGNGVLPGEIEAQVKIDEFTN
jgi:nucleotide-binding universal stress UspA family protein